MVVKVVTESASDLPRDLVERLGITVVPLNVHFGTEVFKDSVDLLPDDFYKRLVEGTELPKTSQPSVGEFAQAYERLSGDADGIVSIHVSSKVSGTHNAAVQASREAPAGCPIEVVDTSQASMGVGLIAAAVASAAQGGASLDELRETARSAVARCECFVMLDTLEYLEKGGRIGKARALLGTLLNVKPLIILRDGEVHELGKERTRSRGLERLRRTAQELAPLDELCVIYSTTPDDARVMAEEMRSLLPDNTEPLIAQFGPVMGTYVGPDAIGMAVLRAAGSQERGPVAP